MKTARVSFTHKGWFGLCPVWIADLETEEPYLWERSILFVPLMLLSIFMFDLCSVILDAFGQPIEGFPIHVTGELPQPLVLMVPSHEDA
jgi:hypothetical protein